MQALQARSAQICQRWEAFLRAERVVSPLANPDALMFLIPATLERVFDVLGKPSQRAPTMIEALALTRRECPCGRNPYLAYFVAGEQALTEALVYSQTEMHNREQRETEVAELFVAIRRLALREVESFCGVCTARPSGHACPNKPPRELPGQPTVAVI